MKKENGKFVKFGVGSDTVLAFVANSSKDNYHLINQKINDGKGYWHQTCEESEEDKYFNKVAYITYTFGKDPIPKDAIILNFDFENQKFQVGNKVYKVKNDDKHTFKFLKKTLKCIGGLEGFYKFIIRETHDQTYLSLMSMLKQAGEIEG